MVNGYAPTSLKEALEIRSAHDVIPYAGGTDLMIGERREGEYLFLNRVFELKRVIRENNMLRLGAGCTFSELIDHPLTPALLKEALRLIAAPAIRNEGTIGGNVGNGSAKADSALIFFAADAKVKLASIAGERVIPVGEFYLGRKKLDLRRDELITEILLPTKWLDHYYYKKVGARKALAISRISFAGLMGIENDVVVHCATAFGAISDVVIRRKDIDGMLVGKTIKQAGKVKNEYLSAFDRAIVPIRGRVSSEYRKKVCLNLLEDFLTENGI